MHPAKAGQREALLGGQREVVVLAARDANRVDRDADFAERCGVVLQRRLRLARELATGAGQQ
ncbi:MAG: hypothetical protein ACYTFT_17700 [Planctomycetota bacterium]